MMFSKMTHELKLPQTDGVFEGNCLTSKNEMSTAMWNQDKALLSWFGISWPFYVQNAHNGPIRKISLCSWNLDSVDFLKKLLKAVLSGQSTVQLWYWNGYWGNICDVINQWEVVYLWPWQASTTNSSYSTPMIIVVIIILGRPYYLFWKSLQFHNTNSFDLLLYYIVTNIRLIYSITQFFDPWQTHNINHVQWNISTKHNKI